MMAYEITTEITVPVMRAIAEEEVGIPWWIWLIGLVVLAMAAEGEK